MKAMNNEHVFGQPCISMTQKIKLHQALANQIILERIKYNITCLILLPEFNFEKLYLLKINLLSKSHRGQGLSCKPLMIGIQMSQLYLRGQLFVIRLVSSDRISRQLSNSPPTFRVNIVQAFVGTVKRNLVSGFQETWTVHVISTAKGSRLDLFIHKIREITVFLS